MESLRANSFFVASDIESKGALRKLGLLSSVASNYPFVEQPAGQAVSRWLMEHTHNYLSLFDPWLGYSDGRLANHIARPEISLEETASEFTDYTAEDIAAYLSLLAGARRVAVDDHSLGLRGFWSIFKKAWLNSAAECFLNSTIHRAMLIQVTECPSVTADELHLLKGSLAKLTAGIPPGNRPNVPSAEETMSGAVNAFLQNPDIEAGLTGRSSAVLSTIREFYNTLR